MSATCTNGTELPYKGYIEADIVVPSLGNTTYKAPVLVLEILTTIAVSLGSLEPMSFLCASKLEMIQMNQ